MSSAAAWRWFALWIGEGSLTALWIRERGVCMYVYVYMRGRPRMFALACYL